MNDITRTAIIYGMMIISLNTALAIGLLGIDFLR
ncbi:putative membrane protein [Brucella sp. 10RB9215]|uniref:Uncharacterized protein n=6 Tax=Brucella TaxID=234 RepID=A9MBX1_BRUC2|nr:hypothetical protein BRA0689 [Brucella suis 1330]ABQ62734.1 hypothetical protein BOV_A0644 [Brucella ovis ATCC 25840]ABX63858.1 Hypothetical protein, conserved [Brucella canis ATCC 23365]ABY39651.1 Hypothetical protein, conserved [Brucella suis ATCC 23445]ACD74015.1 hypothetical protein BAbS19_II05200 [Brucella abortus S19]AEQ10350.1 hypothetical protein BMNI_II0640 [Brucella melitensis NI]AEU07822.1 hypothetical protein BSVBI22_B0681 [Brucella suis VBI22]AHN48418.1 hypothetical protein B